MKLHFSQSNKTPLTSDFWDEILLDHNIQEVIIRGMFDFSTHPEA